MQSLKEWTYAVIRNCRPIPAFVLTNWSRTTIFSIRKLSWHNFFPMHSAFCWLKAINDNEYCLGALGSLKKGSLIAHPQGAMVMSSMLPETNSSFYVCTGWTLLVWIPKDTGTPFNGSCFSFYVSFLYRATPKPLPSLTHTHFQLIVF